MTAKPWVVVAVMGMMCLMPYQSVDLTSLSEDYVKSESSGNSHEILLMGNSYVASNSLHNLIDGVMSAASTPANVSSLNGGGMKLSQHASNVASSGHQWNTTLNNGVWDWVVLQDQSQVPGFPRSQQEWINSKDGAVELVEVIEGNGGETVLMMTWGRRDGDSTNSWRFPDFSTMQDELESGYLDYRDNISANGGNAWVAPVGLAFEHIHDKIVAEGGTPTNSGNTFYNLYTGDGSHPSLSGSYLAAVVLYATITGNDPVGLSHSTSLSNGLVLELQQAAAATVFNETSHLDYPWQTTSSNQSIGMFSKVPNVANNSRIVDSFRISSTANSQSQQNPDLYYIEYESGKFSSVNLQGITLSNGYNLQPSVSLWKFKEQGYENIADELVIEQQIVLSTNFSNFGSCKVHVYLSNISVYCNAFKGSSSEIKLDNNTSAMIEQYQDLFIQWDLNGSLKSYWIPQIVSLSDRWDSSTQYLHRSQFLEDSIFLLITTFSSDILSFPNGNLSCMNGRCTTFAKISLNGTVENYVHFAKWRQNQASYEGCSNVQDFSIANRSAVQIFVQDDQCKIFDSSGNEISITGTGGSTFYTGFDTNLNLIRAIPYYPCTGLYIFDAIIQQENTYYTTKGSGHSTCSNSEWVPNNVYSGDPGRITSIVSMHANGTIMWSYSWSDNSNNLQDYELIALSYGLVWTGPSQSSEIQWQTELDQKYPPYFGPSNFNRDWSPLFNHSGYMIDIYDGNICSGTGASFKLPMIISETNTGFFCGYYLGNSWNYRSYNIDIDGDGSGHTTDSFPFEISQQTDNDLDGYGDNLFGNNSDDCPTEPGNSTLDRLGCLDTDGDGQSNLNDFYPTDPTQVKDSDFDGYGDNLTGTRGDNCPDVYGESNRNNTYGCPDADFDGWADDQDHFENESSQWMDSDGDGYGDEFNGYQGDTCPEDYGLSTKDTFGCQDADGDGWSDEGDDLPFEPTQWLDGDGDGYGNNQSEGSNLVDLFPNDATQWNDTDGDGYGDNRYGSEGDKFPNDPLRWEDTDNDGITDYEDAFPTDITQWNDTDGDGFGDEITGNGGDACPETWGNSTADRRGCVDTDGDGWSDERDDFPNDPSLYLDTDDDGVPDELDVFPFDPTQTEDRDGDGMGDNPMGIGADKFPDDHTQWGDIDGDGYGDNVTGNNPDTFPTDATQWSDMDGDGYGDNPAGRLYDLFPENPTQWEDADGDGLGDNQSGTDADPYLNDFDNDGYNDTIDILPRFASPGDLDADGCLDEVDAFTDNALECLDTDGDGIGNNADADDDNDEWTDADEIRANTDPLDPNDTPVDSFEIVIPGTQIGLGAWDLIGIFGGVPIFTWLAFGFVTRNKRCARYEEMLETANSRQELEQVALKWEYSLMLRLLGPHQGIRLERIRSELDDKFENAENMMASEEFEPMTEVDQTPIVESQQKVIPEIGSGPSISAVADQIDENGYSWLMHEGKQWYRTNSESHWFEFEN